MKRALILFITIMLYLPLLAQDRITVSTVHPRTRQSIAVDPVLAPLGTLTAEVERTLFSPKTSVGLSGWYEYDNVRARWLYAKVMVYPGGEALKGCGIGLTSGLLTAYQEENDGKREHETAPILGIMTQYNWLPGSSETILVGLGIGGRVTLKRLDDGSPLNRFDGHVRLVLGWML